MWRHTRSPVTQRSTPATQAQAAPDTHVGQPGTKDRTQIEAHGASQARGVHWGRTVETVVERDSSRFITIRRATSRFGHFGWPFPSQDGPPEKKYHLESGLNQRDRAECKKRYVGSSAGARSKTTTWGVIKHKPAHAVPVASARPDQNPRAVASQPGLQIRTRGPLANWPTGARWRVQLSKGSKNDKNQ